MNIAIIGAGIGGLTTAIALRNLGFDPEIYEAAPKLEKAGSGIWLPSNAMQVMSRLGIADELMAAGLPLSRIEVWDGTKRLSAIELGPMAEKFDYTTISIHRAALQRVLLSRVPEERLHFGKRAKGAEQSADEVSVSFEDGTHVQADVVVAADGLRSAVRSSIFGEVELRYSGQSCYRGIAELKLPHGLHDVCRETWGGDVRLGFSAITEDTVYWFSPLRAEPGQPDDDANRQALRKRLAAFPDPIPSIIDATPDEAIQRLDIFDFETISRWHEGRVVLVGDAGHATTPNLGQGGAQAIESAYVLAKCLKEEENLDAALSRYQTMRKAKAKKVNEVSWRLGQAAHYEGFAMRGIRNLMMSSMPSFIERKQFEELYCLGYD